APTTVSMRMRIRFARTAVRCPTGVADTTLYRTIRRIGCLDLFFERSDSADRSDDVGLSFVHDCHAAGIVTAIFKSLEAIDQNTRDFSGPDISNDPPHIPSRPARRLQTRR